MKIKHIGYKNTIQKCDSWLNIMPFFGNQVKALVTKKRQSTSPKIAFSAFGILAMLIYRYL